MTASPETLRAMDDLKQTWAAVGPTQRATIRIGLGLTALYLAIAAFGTVTNRADPHQADATPTPARIEAFDAPTRTAPTPTMTVVDGPVTLALEKGPADPAGKLRRIAAGHVPTLQIGYRWFGKLEEQSIEGFDGPQGWTAHFTWSRKPWGGANIDVFQTEAQAAAALEQVMGGPASLLLIPNTDGKTRYVAMDIAAPDGSATYSMRCAVRVRSFYCSTIPSGVPAIVTVQLLIDTVSGTTRPEIQAKVDEMTREMGRETDEVMRSLAAQGLDGTRAVARYEPSAPAP